MCILLEGLRCPQEWSFRKPLILTPYLKITPFPTSFSAKSHLFFSTVSKIPAVHINSVFIEEAMNNWKNNLNEKWNSSIVNYFSYISGIHWRVRSKDAHTKWSDFCVNFEYFSKSMQYFLFAQLVCIISLWLNKWLRNKLVDHQLWWLI